MGARSVVSPRDPLKAHRPERVLVAKCPHGASRPKKWTFVRYEHRRAAFNFVATDVAPTRRRMPRVRRSCPVGASSIGDRWRAVTRRPSAPHHFGVADVQAGVLPCQPKTFHHIPNLTSPLGLDSGLDGLAPSRPPSFLGGARGSGPYGVRLAECGPALCRIARLRNASLLEWRTTSRRRRLCADLASATRRRRGAIGSANARGLEAVTTRLLVSRDLHSASRSRRRLADRLSTRTRTRTSSMGRARRPSPLGVHPGHTTRNMDRSFLAATPRPNPDDS